VTETITRAAAVRISPRLPRRFAMGDMTHDCQYDWHD
jgi:hypothetical protein